MFPTKLQRPKLHMFRRSLREFVVSLALGSGPVFINSESAQALATVLNALLAPAPLMEYYFAFFIAFLASVLLVQRRMKSSTKRLPSSVLFLCRLLGDVGSAFLSATRTAAGALIGFATVWCFQKPESAYLLGVLWILFLAAVLIVFSAALAIGEETLKDPNGTSEQP